MKEKAKTPRLAAGELEMLQMLWREKGVTIREAQQALDLPIGYTTVQTRLNRLVNKGIAKKSRKRPAKYTAAVTPEQVREQDLHLLVQRVSDGQVVPLVAQLVRRSRLTQKEIREIRKLLAQAERKDEGKDKRSP